MHILTRHMNLSQMPCVETRFLDAPRLRRIPSLYSSVYNIHTKTLHAHIFARHMHAPMCINIYNIHKYFCMHTYSHDTHTSQVPSVDTVSFIPLSSAVYPPCARAERTAQTQEALRLFALHLRAPDLALPPAAHATPLHDALDSLCAAALEKPAHAVGVHALQVRVTACVSSTGSMSMCVCIYIYAYICIFLYMYSCCPRTVSDRGGACLAGTPYVCVHIYVYVYINIYIHRYIFTDTPS